MSDSGSLLVRNRVRVGLVAVSPRKAVMRDDGRVVYAVIPAGGSGTRLWPLSRSERPKFLLPLTGSSDSLLQATVRRLGALTAPERTFVVTGERHAPAVAAQLPKLPAANLLVEPSPRDSAAAIGLAAAVIAERDPQAVMASFAADHLVPDEERFAETVAVAAEGAADGWLMTVGMRPTRPETGFGYVQCGDAVDGGLVRRVHQFKEKPDRATAEQFVRSGDYLWNASMFLWRVDVFLDELAAQQPALHAGLRRIAAAWDTAERASVLAHEWPQLPRVAVEYAVMEDAARRGRVATVPGDFGWSDVGDFQNIGDLLPADHAGNVSVADDGGACDDASLLTVDCDRTVAVQGAPRHSQRMVALLGLSDVVVVDTPDVLLVCDRERAQEVKQLVDTLKERGRSEVL